VGLIAPEMGEDTARNKAGATMAADGARKSRDEVHAHPTGTITWVVVRGARWLFLGGGGC